MDQRRRELDLNQPSGGGICVRELGVECQCLWCRGVLPRPGEAEPEGEKGEE